MKRVMITWTESTQETKEFMVEDDWTNEPDADGRSPAEDLIVGDYGRSLEYAVEDREVHEVIEDEGDAPCCPDPGCPGNPQTFPGYVPNN